MNQESVNQESTDDIEDDFDFEACSNCDGHAACEDFGCAFQLGCGHLVQEFPDN